MKNLFLLLIPILLISVSCNTKEQKKTVEKKTVKKKIIYNQDHLLAAALWHQTSAEAKALFMQNYKLAGLMLNKNIAESESSKPKAIITDLDETVIDNSPFTARMIIETFDYSPKRWHEWVKEAKAEALPGAKAFLSKADKLGVKIFYVSNRADSSKNYTIKNLEKLELPQISEESVVLKTTTSNKTERRENILKNYDVILYLGDNLTDFSEDFADRGADYGEGITKENMTNFGSKFIVFANPLYGEWEKAILKNTFSHSPKEKDQLMKDALITKK
ncbi:MAG: 5'-nucleotidase, lipoprotein e(P4) family [Bacteroidota bacterium]|nr:5'-nucleotidase, lipoprotein e(P4) family [Bacteroidota bacterium]